MDADLAAAHFTIGRSHYPGYALPLALYPLDAGDLPLDRLCIIHLDRGSAVWRQALVVAPAILLAVTSLDFATRTGAQGRLLSFDPGVVNGNLSMDLLRQPGPLAGTTEQDAYLLRPFLDTAGPGHVIALDAQLAGAVRGALDRIDRETAAQRDLHWPCRTRSFLIELLFRLRLAVDHAPAAGLCPESPLDKALPLIREHLAEKLPVQQLAHLCGTNRSSLNAAFRAATGHSVHAYIIQLRMEMAAALLRDTGLPVAEIMARVGYENASHFGRQFKATFDMGPRRYRNAQSTMPGRRRRPSPQVRPRLAMSIHP